jgi:hypothetical protein
VNAKQKKALVRFVVAGVIALILHKAEDVINDKTDEYFGADEKSN